MDRREHWENIYKTKDPSSVSWYQKKPELSISLIEKMNLDKSARIIDVGAGRSFLVDHLLAMGYKNLTVLDISAEAVKKSKERLGDNAEKVNWIVGDILNVEFDSKFDIWHDRAVFHFITNSEDITNYKKKLENSLSREGKLIIGTFSKNGPTKCSGIEIKQYSKESLSFEFSYIFQEIECFNTDHQTPSGKIQNFSFCTFEKQQTK